MYQLRQKSSLVNLIEGRGRPALCRVSWNESLSAKENFRHRGIAFCCVSICIMAKFLNFSIPFDK